MSRRRSAQMFSPYFECDGRARGAKTPPAAGDPAAEHQVASASTSAADKPVLLVFEFYQLGDAMLSLPFLRGALEKYRVVVCCVPRAAALYQICLPEVETLAYRPLWRGWWNVASSAGDDGNLIACVRQMRALKPAVAASIWPDPRVQFLMRCSGAPERVGFRPVSNNLWAPRYLRLRWLKVRAACALAWLAQKVTVSAWLTRELDRGYPTRAQWKSWRQLAETLAVPWRDQFPWFAAGHEVPPAVGNFLAAARAERREVFLIHSGARHASRRWPRERFAAVINDYLLPRGAAVIISDSGEGNLPQVSSAACLTWRSRGLAEFFAVLAQADAVLCNDSFPAHAAAALGKKVFTIFSAQDAEWFAPYGSERRVIQKDACQYRPCLDYCKQPSYLCLEAVTPADVINQLAADDER